jgi:hypothetical protein
MNFILFWIPVDTGCGRIFLKNYGAGKWSIFWMLVYPSKKKKKKKREKTERHDRLEKRKMSYFKICKAWTWWYNTFPKRRQFCRYTIFMDVCTGAWLPYKCTSMARRKAESGHVGGERTPKSDDRSFFGNVIKMPTIDLSSSFLNVLNLQLSKFQSR